MTSRSPRPRDLRCGRGTARWNRLFGERERRAEMIWRVRFFVSIEDVTGTAHAMERLVVAGDSAAALRLAPVERRYPTPDDIAVALGMRVGAAPGSA